VDHRRLLQKKRASPQHWEVDGSDCWDHPAGLKLPDLDEGEAASIRLALGTSGRAVLLIDERSGGPWPRDGLSSAVQAAVSSHGRARI